LPHAPAEAGSFGVVRSPQVVGTALRRQFSIAWLPITAKLKHLESPAMDNVMKRDVG